MNTLHDDDHRSIRTTVLRGWCTLALINAGLARGKNRSGLGWFLLSLLLGPIATFIVVILDKQPASLTASMAPRARAVV